ncbi:septum formation initiator [Micromonospora sp. NPDC049836]|uniref:septum formation initiator n=1 Tax=Micromonospora sp. NPDC049836 TaxID=3364274 RepID=UPI0037BBECB8
MGRRPILVAATGWLAATVLATLVGLGAIQLVGDGITGTPGGVLDQGDVERALAAAPTGGATGAATPTTVAASPTRTPSGGPPAAGRRSFATAGGTAVAECGPAGIRLISWSPAPGYRAKDADRGPDEHVEVRFVGAEGEYELRLRCVDGRPAATRHD